MQSLELQTTQHSFEHVFPDMNFEILDKTRIANIHNLNK